MYPTQNTRSLLWTLACGLNIAVISVSAFNPDSFENAGVTRTIDLGGSLTQVTTTYAVRALANNLDQYFIALSDEEEGHTTWIDAKLKGQSEALELKRHGFNPKSHAFLYSINLPKTLKNNQTANIVVSTVQSHASTPLPETAAQGDPQSLMYQTPLYVLSPYKSVVQRTKIRSSTPMIHSYTDSKDLSEYIEAGSSAVAKTGATLVYGPFHNVPASSNLPFQEKKQKTVSVHYDHDQPVLTVASLQRSAEISHWGANLNIHDEIVLRNDGPALKGHFSRLEHQSQAKSSILELRPRYPLLGGWNYTFTLGYDTPLESAAKYDASTGKYVVAIPYLTNIPGAAFEETELKIIFPEGARDVTLHTPFGPDSIENEQHVTYLDTTGRPAITLKKKNLSDKHAGTIYVTYSLSVAAHFKKPIAVTSAALALFTFALGARRFDLALHK
ncbi:oligosaccharyltransferase complex subunit alpha (ribophorin I) [Rhizoctonia solani AG-1 IB]|uniref:Dolichyl-diphosphooligosaccharide--protein glycosyltransferase subunit 1 n=1 Tax=Thanatephorus cucumeris (strain AG1-IB / isolate 7/3/14) TaxID=1108050 RepID=A0A0B7FUF7_THACB|nr:oligosaccharyltransferase complex subunit alpha (ribophorin I) [Rhizoctonia solani AG-1 IB]